MPIHRFELGPAIAVADRCEPRLVYGAWEGVGVSLGSDLFGSDLFDSDERQ